MAVVAGALMISACGSDDTETTTSSSSDTTDSAITSSSATDSTDSSGSSSSSTTSTTDSSTSSSDTGPSTTGSSTTELPGDDWDGFANSGDILAVVGVASDDTLNVRAVPGTDQAVVATAAPTADDLVATGRARELPTSFWYEVTVDGEVGWVSSRFVAFMGGTDDFTAEFLSSGDRPAAETMVDLAEFVAATVASQDPPSNVVQSVAPTVGDLAEITYDVIGIGDDAVSGYRLHIFAVEDEGGESFSLRTIERTTFCTRGLSGELCT